MPIARKTDISTKGSWLGKKPQRRSRRRATQAFINLDSPIGSTTKQRQTSSKQVYAGKQQPSTTKGEIPLVPTSRDMPSWLIRLYTLQRYSSITTFLLVGITLLIYGWTVYSQQLWSQAYHQFQNLQRDERQLTATNEVLKNKMAQEGEQPSTGLVSPSPAGTIFLPTTSVPVKVQPTTTPNPQTEQQNINPVPGY